MKNIKFSLDLGLYDTSDFILNKTINFHNQ